MKQIFAAGPSVTEVEVSYVMDALKNGWYENAYHYCEIFQKEFAAYHNRKYGIMTPNCTTALHLLLTALGVSDNDEVIVPDCTWVGSTAGISYLRAKTIFSDIDPVTWCIDVNSIRERITPKTKAIIAVDLFGNMPNFDELQRLADEKGLVLIEDAAEALGSTYKGVKAGKFGKASVFSFHRTKTICTGEGGMLLLDDDKLYERCMFLRDHGRKPSGKPYYNYEITYKYMPFNIQAALGYAQFKRIDELLKMKRHHLESYKNKLKDIPDITFNPEPEGGINGAWITGLVFGKSHDISKEIALEKLNAIKIPARPFFYPLSSLPAYDQQSAYETKNKIAYDISSRGINLPGAFNLTDDQIDYVCDGIKKLVDKKL
ncbi:MAG: DegT/DnrJ/EryC1/StrS family aminotransferase [Bdellovibrionota bacterium]